MSKKFQAPAKSVGPNLKDSTNSLRIKTIREAANEDIAKILSDIKEKRTENQKITFIFDASIIGPLNLLIPGSLLKDEGTFQLLNIIPEKKKKNLKLIMKF